MFPNHDYFARPAELRQWAQDERLIRASRRRRRAERPWRVARRRSAGDDVT